MLRALAGQRLVPGGPVRIVRDPAYERRYADRLRPLDAHCAIAVGANHRDLGWHLPRRARLDQVGVRGSLPGLAQPSVSAARPDVVWVRMHAR